MQRQLTAPAPLRQHQRGRDEAPGIAAGVGGLLPGATAQCSGGALRGTSGQGSRLKTGDTGTPPSEVEEMAHLRVCRGRGCAAMLALQLSSLQTQAHGTCDRAQRRTSRSTIPAQGDTEAGGGGVRCQRGAARTGGRDGIQMGYALTQNETQRPAVGNVKNTLATVTWRGTAPHQWPAYRQ